jgi:predicted transcriptional regulator
VSNRDRIYDFIIRYKIEHQGNSPTIREICDGLNLSVGCVTYNLDMLDAEDRISISRNKASHIKIPGAKWWFPHELTQKYAEHVLEVAEQGRIEP